VRVKVSATGSGKWAASGGDSSKFGISITELVRLLDDVNTYGIADGFSCFTSISGARFSMFRISSRRSRRSRAFTRLCAGADLIFDMFNVGGGLGGNYEAGEVTSPHGINYTLEEYVNAVVYSVKEVCDAEKSSASHSGIRKWPRPDGRIIPSLSLR